MKAPAPAYCRPAAYRAFAEHLPIIGAPAGLFRAAWAIAQHEIPEASLADGEAAVTSLETTVRRRVRSSSDEAVLAHLHDVLFEVIGFRGNRDDYYSPMNSYLPEVLRNRTGLPISLTLLYCRVATGLGLTVHGVNAPGHFLAEAEIHEAQGRRTIFIDPFHGGDLLHEHEALERVAQATGGAVQPHRDHLRRATPRQWLARMLHNLQAAMAALGRDRDLFAMQELEQLLDRG